MATPSHFQIINKNNFFQIKSSFAIRVGNAFEPSKCGVHTKLTKRCLKLNGKKRPTMKQVEIDLQQLGRFQEQFSCQKSMIQEDFSQQQTCQDDCTVSERSHSYTFGPATEEIVQDIEVLFS